jgi:hypothetical protein
MSRLVGIARKATKCRVRCVQFTDRRTSLCLSGRLKRTVTIEAGVMRREDRSISTSRVGLLVVLADVSHERRCRHCRLSTKQLTTSFMLADNA